MPYYQVYAVLLHGGVYGWLEAKEQIRLPIRPMESPGLRLLERLLQRAVSLLHGMALCGLAEGKELIAWSNPLMVSPGHQWHQELLFLEHVMQLRGMGLVGSQLALELMIRSHIHSMVLPGLGLEIVLLHLDILGKLLRGMALYGS
jgi:hypothetical protein